MTLKLVDEFPLATTVNLGGGFKVGRMSYESHLSTNLQSIGNPIHDLLVQYNNQNIKNGKGKRKLHLEIEPGTFLLANAGTLLTTINDITITGTGTVGDGEDGDDDNDDDDDGNVGTGTGSNKGGYEFLKLDSGMTEVLRPSLYGAQHPIVGFSSSAATATATNNDTTVAIATKEYIITGHCCESGDLFSCKSGESEVLQPRILPIMSIGDMLSIEGSGAYCSSMSTKNYNSFPETSEILLSNDRITYYCIRKKQTIEQMICNEIALPEFEA